MPNSVDEIFEKGSTDSAETLTRLKKAILTDGINQDADGMSRNRAYIWSLFLVGSEVLTFDTYEALILRGASPAYAKIRNDTFRTLATDPLFKRRVTENSISRILNSVAWSLHDANALPTPQKDAAAARHPPTIPLDSTTSPSPISLRTSEPLRPANPTNSHRSPNPDSPRSDSSPTSLSKIPTSSPLKSPLSRTTTVTVPATAATATTTTPSSFMAPARVSSIAPPSTTTPELYIQGMNVLAAPFLYACRSEHQAYQLLSRLISVSLPAYIRPALPGVHRGLHLIDSLLGFLDPKLATHLAASSLSAAIYAFPSVLTLCACTPPLPEVLLLWDFLLAWGPHLNLLAVVAQVVMMRDELLAEKSPGKLLRSFPPLRAGLVVELTVSFVKKLDQRLYRELVEHTL